MQQNQIAEILSHPISQELVARDLLRMAYVSQDGTPRTIPISLIWSEARVPMIAAM